jgi:hypothetical protein
MSIKTPDRKRRNGLAAFRAVELEVRAALSAGWTLAAIYEEKRGRLGMSYAQFARYAQPLRKAAKAQPAAARIPTTPTTPAAQPTPATERKHASATGPPKGRPEDAVPTLDMDGFATKALRTRTCSSKEATHGTQGELHSSGHGRCR